MKKRLHAYFSGMVQGVGFRYTAERLARHFPVSGYVRNLSNGQVELVAEGEEISLQDFLKAVRESFGSYVQKADVHWEEPTGEYETFGVKF